MSDCVSQDVDFWAKSTPPEDGTFPFDRVPYEVVENILWQFVSDTLILANDVPRRAPHKDLLVVRLTCRIMYMLCAPIVRELFEEDRTPDERPLPHVLRATAAHERACRKLVVEGSSARVLCDLRDRSAQWEMALPSVVEVVLSGTERVTLNGFTSFAELRHLTVTNAELTLVSRRTTSFPSLTSLTLSGVTLTEPWILSRSTFPALRRLSIVNCRTFEWLYRKEHWATDLLPQLDCLEVGEDIYEDADARLLIPLDNLPDTLPILSRVNINRDLDRFASRRERAALPRHTLVRLVIGTRTPRPGHFDKILDILARLPNLELLLVPLAFWSPPAPQPHLGSTRPASHRAVQQAAQRQRAVVDECARRGVALRTYDEREGEGSVPELEQFLRERAGPAAGSGT
ncbi:hypothetical protein JCM9279_004970 [Rhodotorula babjevae]